MTVLRSREVDSVVKKMYPSKMVKNGVEIEPLTPVKSVELTKKLCETTTPSADQLFENLGESGSGKSPNSGVLLSQGPRRSLRLSSKSSSIEVVENVRSRKKPKVINVENGEECRGIGVSRVLKTVSSSEGNDSYVSDSSTEDPAREKTRSVKKVKRKRVIDVESLGSESVGEGDVGTGCLKLRSGKKLLNPSVEHDGGGDEMFLCEDGKKGKEIEVENVVDKKRGTRGIENGYKKARRSVTSQDKNKGILVDEINHGELGLERKCETSVGEEMNIDLMNGVNVTSEGNRRRLSIQEKGKGKVVEVDSYLYNNSDSDDPNLKPIIGSLVETIVSSSVNLEPVTNEIAYTSTRYCKERFKNIARENASRFAYFSAHEEEDPAVDGAELELSQGEAKMDVEDWPGPFSTALKIIKERSLNIHAQQTNLNKSQSVPLIWIPKKNEKCDHSNKVAPSLQELCMPILAENVDAITSLESVPDVLRHKLTQVLCDCRKMNTHFFDLLASGSPSEIRIRDSSWLTEEQFTKTFERTDVNKLTVLQLDQCGRCLPDYVLFTTLGCSPNKLSALTTISLRGACRLSDAGLTALVASAPALRSMNLGCCSLLTADGINSLADKLGSVLKELYIDECFSVDAMGILPALMKLEHLEVLSVSHLETVCDSFIKQLVAVRGQMMKELVLADCIKLTDKSLKAIAESCPWLCAIDLSNLRKLTDSAIGYLANGCQTIQTMKLRCNAFSDEAVAAYLEACGEPLKELSLNHVDKVGHETALSLAKRSRNLVSLDLSWCRNMTNEALGLVVDSCFSLKVLKLFGCTQITNIFGDGHSNPQVKIIGLEKSQILKNIEAPDLLPLHYSSV